MDGLRLNKILAEVKGFQSLLRREGFSDHGISLNFCLRCFDDIDEKLVKGKLESFRVYLSMEEECFMWGRMQEHGELEGFSVC